jgi:hypothetical protein
MSDTLARSPNFRFIAETHWDEVLPSGLKLNRTDALRFSVRRPDALRLEFHGADDDRLLVYDGSMATMFDRNKRFYATRSAPGTLDAAIDMLAHEVGLTVPLADFLFEDPGKVLLANVTAGSYVGKELIGETPTDHVVFSQAGMDWQLWVAEGEEAFPLRFALTYLRVDGQPQFMATLSDWDVNAELPPTEFKVSIPGDAEQIEFVVDTSGGE